MSTEDEDIINNLEETEVEGLVEIFIRMNDEEDKDYCFQVSTNSTFKDLLKIFDRLPLTLAPTCFQNLRPVGFQVSTSPGFLTASGGLLFDDDATNKKYLVNVALSDKIGDKVWPGQLIVPKWEFNPTAFLVIQSIFLLWLYTDLPDFISPTPGISLTSQALKAGAYIARLLHYNDFADLLLNELLTEESKFTQTLFFVFHVAKIAFLELLLYFGFYRPYTFDLFHIFTPAPAPIDKETLKKIGWTGARKVSVQDYKSRYRDHQTKKVGSLLKAKELGLFEKIIYGGVQLKDGEGWNTPLPTEDDKGAKSNTLDKLLQANGKFILNYDYIAHIGEFWETNELDVLLAKKDQCENEEELRQLDQQLNKAARDFRSYGPLECSEKVTKIVDNRMALK
ncbi:BA75_02842T0 [Komagataella pastoris]|uniref:BA75_02842T0 n=1 Tax=Komagataella pastoris TaxID=4922 RepID=A0A1B2JDK6_PICPA|nr:BA75_02842T0 [Komagataella pastoris]